MLLYFLRVSIPFIIPSLSCFIFSCLFGHKQKFLKATQAIFRDHFLGNHMMLGIKLGSLVYTAYTNPLKLSLVPFYHILYIYL